MLRRKYSNVLRAAVEISGRLRRGWKARRLLSRLLIALGASLAAIVLLLAVTPQGKAVVKTALFVPEVLPAIPIKPQTWFIREPVVSEVHYPTSGGEAVADLYRPASSGKHSAVLFFQGVVPGGRFDPRLVALAKALARSGMVVMIPWLDTQIKGEIVPEDIDNLVRGFQYLRVLDGVDPDRVGMGGICVGASLATVAAQDERIRDQVKFVNFFAGYYDAIDLTKAIGSRSRFYGDYVAPWNTDRLTYEVFRYHLTVGLTDRNDKNLIVRIFQDKDETAEAEVDSLTSEGRAVYGLLKGVPLEEAEVLVTQLPSETIKFLRLISPSTHIDQLKARMLIMHDRADALVPSEESRRLADALGSDSDTYHTEFSLFQKEIRVHVGETSGVGPLDYAKEAFKFFMHMYNIMRDVS